MTQRILFAICLAALVTGCEESPSTPELDPPPSLAVASTALVTHQTEVAPLTAGAYFSCALRADDTLSCWGGGPGPGYAGAQFSGVSGGMTHTCGILKSDQSVLCWGGDGSGQSNYPPGSFKEVSSGPYTVCAIRTDETIVCWGSHNWGAADFPPGTYKHIAVGAGNNCAIRTDGSLVCRGLHAPGVVGQVPEGTFEQVTINHGWDACAIRTDGGLVCWGGTLLSGPPAGTFTQVNAGWASACALRTDGTIACWGANPFGEAEPPEGTFVRISVGAYHACAQRADRCVVCWGLNNEGQTDVPAEFAAPALTADAGGPYTVQEGATLTVDGSGSSSGSGLTYLWDFGDGATGTGIVPRHAYADDGSYQVVLMVSDGQGGEVVATTSVEVTNAAPTVHQIGLTRDAVAVGESTSISAAFTDPGVLDTHTASVDWGEVTSTSTVVGGAGVGSVQGSHSYGGAGFYTVRVTVEDDDGGTGSRASALDVPSYIAVYDPNAGSVTGGGWIDSPAGACSLSSCAGTTGKASFGFEARYRRGEDAPTGNLEFQLQRAFRFKSTIQHWLVISGGRGHLRGIGAIDGNGSYPFLLTVIDGRSGDGIDRFRLQIWDPDTGASVYDNQVGEPELSDAATALGGGSVVVR